MTTSAIKPELKRLNRFDQTGSTRPKAGSTPPPRPEVALRSCVGCPFHGTECTGGLIWAQNRDIMQVKAFYLKKIGYGSSLESRYLIVGPDTVLLSLTGG
jgi:hypothetical protein